MKRCLLALGIALVLIGCRGGARVAPETLLARTTEALVDALVGPPPEVRAARTVPLDPPLLRSGGHERAVLAVDVDAFARMASRAFSRDDLRALERQVVEATHRILQKRGDFSLQSVPFPPPPLIDDATLTATLTPMLQEIGSPQERASGRGRTLVLVRLTITDRAGTVLAQRDYASGRDRQPRPESDWRELSRPGR